MATRCGGTAGAGEIRPLATWPTAGAAGAERLPWASWGCGAPRDGCDVCCGVRDAVGETVWAMGQRLHGAWRAMAGALATAVAERTKVPLI